MVDGKGRLYKDLPRDIQRQMENYSIGIIRYSNATDEQAIDIFTRAQLGLPLTIGQLMYSVCAISPLVKYAKETLLTVGSGLHDRAQAVWGKRAGIKDVKRTVFCEAVILAMTAVFGETTKKWNEIDEKKFLAKDISTLTANATDILTKLISIYEQAEVRLPVRGKAMLNRQWSLRNFSPYILWSLKKYPEEHDRLIAGWVNWLVMYRENDTLLDTVLKRDVSSARSWNDQRWKFGYLRVFEPDSPDLPTNPMPVLGTDSDDDDESEE